MVEHDGFGTVCGWPRDDGTDVLLLEVFPRGRGAVNSKVFYNTKEGA